MAIDGNSIVNRAFFGVRHLSASDGTPTNAVYGFLSILHKLIAEESPDALCVAFDLPAPTFRHEKYDKYKAHRKAMPEELVVQMPILKDVLDAMNIKRYELAGWEADDILGTLSKICEADKWECIIVTGDKDTLQLVTDHTKVKHIKTKGGKTETNDYTPEVFVDEYGFVPTMMVDLKALMGDSSDNIPGVAGVGEKTAMELVQKFGRVTDIYNNLNSLDIKDTLKNKLEAGRENAELSYTLADINVGVPIHFSPEENIVQSPDNDKLYELFKRLRFSTFIEKYKLKPPRTSATTETQTIPKIINITTASECLALLENARTAEFVSISLNTEFFDSIAVAMTILQEENTTTIKNNNPITLYLLQKETTETYNNTLSGLLSDDVKKVGHDVKDIMRYCMERGIRTGNWVFDTALAAYLISPTDSNYSINRIAEYYCDISLKTGSDESGQMSMLENNDKPIAEEAFAINILKNTLSNKLKEQELAKLYYDIELPLCQVLADMEIAGFLIDKDALALYSAQLSDKINKLETQIYDQAHETFNINSPKQLGIILFEKLMLPAPKKTKTGYSTNIEVLDSLIGKHPIIDLIKEYRELTKLKSTYAEGLLKCIGSDGRIHTHFQMTVTSTGRLSSSEPNLQNIPIRKETGEELRKMFVAADGNVLVDADYSQIELRLLAHIANDPVMLAAFENGEDIHTVTASQVFNVPISKVTPTERFRAKAVNFGIVYGISAFSLANDIGVNQKEAKAYIDSYFEKYSSVQNYMKDIIKTAAKQGYVSTLFGRRRDLPELKSSNFNTRSFGERVALNMPIQGTAADIMKIAMLNVSNRLKKEKLAAKIILQVHDELIVECPDSESEVVSAILREEMENAAKLSVPLVAETRVGKSWYDAK
ncbi:MAG: DNA polymerase I [Oscillospiraceae bacterium]|jgi:DNA polymerase-1|nr:DNA polymerase I [Oscillospiraceae bacterium]